MLRRILIISFLLVTSFFSQTNLSNKYRLAQTYERAGRLEKAKEVLKEIFTAQPSNNQFLNSLNDIYLKLKNYEESIQLLSKQINLHPNDVNLYGMLGVTFYISGNSKKAVDTWDKGVALNNHSQINYTIISNYAIQNRSFEVAIKYLKEAKERFNSTQFSYQLAQIYVHTMSYKKATLEYLSILKQQPSQLGYIERRMEMYLSASGAVDESISVIDKGETRKPIQELLAFLYIKNNQFGKAFEIEKRLAIDNNENRIYDFANNAYRSKVYKIAAKAYRYVVDNYPSSRFIPNCKIGFARTREAELIEDKKVNHSNWKPIAMVDTTGAYKYLPIIETYKSLIPILNGELKKEALFRIGKLYLSQLNNYELAEEYFKQVTDETGLSTYYGKANLELARIFILSNELTSAKKNLQNVLKSSRAVAGIKQDAKLLIAKIEFYQSNFEEALALLAGINKDLSDDASNNAIQLAMVINIGRRDSVNLDKFAKAELYAAQLNFTKAEIIYKELSENQNLYIINNISRMKYAEVLIAQDKFPIVIEVLKKLSDTKELNIFTDRSFYLLAQVYEFGIKDWKSAMSIYEKFLEIFPNSLYLEKAKRNLTELKTREN